MLSLHLSSSGELTASDARRNQTVQVQVAPEELARLAGLLQAACPFPTGGRPATCPDCFNYDLLLTADGRFYKLQATDIGQSGAGALIYELNALLEQSLPAGP